MDAPAECSICRPYGSARSRSPLTANRYFWPATTPGSKPNHQPFSFQSRWSDRSHELNSPIKAYFLRVGGAQTLKKTPFSVSEHPGGR